MNQLLNRISITMNKRYWRKTGYVDTKGMFDTKLFYEKQGEV